MGPRVLRFVTFLPFALLLLLSLFGEARPCSTLRRIIYAMTYNLDTISRTVSMQSRKGVPFGKWFHLDEEFIG